MTLKNSKKNLFAVFNRDYKIVFYETDIQLEKEEISALKDILESEYKVLRGSDIKYINNKYKGVVIVSKEQVDNLTFFLNESKFRTDVISVDAKVGFDD